VTETVRAGPQRLRRDLFLHLTRASAVSMGVRVTGLVLVFLSHLLLSRALGASQYGQYMIGLGWAMVLVIPARMGLDNSVLRFATVYREEARAGDLRGLIAFSLCAIALVSASIVGAMTLAKAAAAEPLKSIGWLMISGIALMVPTLAILGWLSALVRTANRIFASQFYEQVMRPMLLIALVALAILSGRRMDAGAAMLLTSVAVLLSMGAITVHARRTFAGLPPERVRIDHRREWLSVSWPLFLMAVAQELLNQLDLIMLGLLSNASQAAHFAASSRLASLVVFGLMAIGTVSGPLIASAYNRRDMHELKRIAKLSARLSTMFAMIIAAFLVMFGKQALGLFGPGFVAGYPALLILLVGGLANSLTGAVGYLLIMTGSEKQAVRILAASLVISFLGNLILIPKMGAVGAAIASTLALTAWNIAMIIHVRRKLGIDATALGTIKAFAGKTV
jgi:O-antigen/teichoic acid export membrane protein